jgi:DNA repair protein RadD
VSYNLRPQAPLVPRDYQGLANNMLWEFVHQCPGRNPLVLMPTGTGKSFSIAYWFWTCLMAYPYMRGMMLTHVETLVSQNLQKLQQLWPTCPVGVYNAAMDRRDTHQQIIYASIQSVYERAALFPWLDFIVVDEAHLIGDKEASMYQTLFAALRAVNPRIIIVGFTATDWRLGSGRLTNGTIFTDVAVNMTTPEWWAWFVAQGYLSPLYSKRTQLRIDTSGIGMTHGEYNLGQQQTKLDNEQLTRSAIEEMLWWGQSQNRNKWMVFATGVKHCDHIVDWMGEYGINAVAIHSKTKKPQDLIEAYKAGQYQCAVSMNQLTTGVDVPDVDLLGVLRLTNSSGMWVQLLGRGTRPVYGDVLDMAYDPSSQLWRLAAIAAGVKPHGCLVLDFARNAERLGTIDNPKVQEVVKGKRQGGVGHAVVKVCPTCAEYVAAAATICSYCLHEFDRQLHLDPTASDAQVMGLAVQEEMVVEDFDVAHVVYHKVNRRNADPVLRVSYYVTLLQKFDDYYTFTEGRAARAKNWWRAACGNWPVGTEPPDSVEEAIALSGYLRAPKRVRVWSNLKKPKVIDHEYV